MKRWKNLDKSKKFEYIISGILIILIIALLIFGAILCEVIDEDNKIHIDPDTGVNYIKIGDNYVPRYDSNGNLIITPIEEGTEQC